MLLIIVANALAAAQDRAQTVRVTNDKTRIVDNVYLITVTVNLGRQSSAVDLARDNFALSDNGIRQEIPFFTRIAPSNSGDNDIIYALGYKPPVWLFNGKRRKVSVVVYNAKGKTLKAHFSPREYLGTRAYLDGP